MEGRGYQFTPFGMTDLGDASGASAVPQDFSPAFVDKQPPPEPHAAARQPNPEGSNRPHATASPDRARWCERRRRARRTSGPSSAT
jgi:hypothetical protein